MATQKTALLQAIERHEQMLKVCEEYRRNQTKSGTCEFSKSTSEIHMLRRSIETLKSLLPVEREQLIDSCKTNHSACSAFFNYEEWFNETYGTDEHNK